MNTATGINRLPSGTDLAPGRLFIYLSSSVFAILLAAAVAGFYFTAPRDIALATVLGISAAVGVAIYIFVLVQPAAGLLLYFVSIVLNFVELQSLSVGGADLSIRPMDLAAVSLIFGWVAKEAPRGVRLKLTASMKIFGVFILWALAGFVSSVIRRQGVIPSFSQILALSRLIEQFLVYFVFLQILWNEKDTLIEQGIRILNVCFTILVAVTVYKFMQMGDEGRILFFFPTTGINALGMIFVAFALLNIERLARAPGRLNRLEALLFTFVFMIAVLFTFSRSSLLGLFVSMIYISIRYRRLGIIAMGLLFAGLVYALFPDIVVFLIQRVLQTFMPGSFEYRSGVVERMLPWSVAWKVFLLHPITGVGYYLYPDYTPVVYRAYQITAENYHLRLLADTGAGGYALFMLFVFSIWRKAIRLRRAAASLRTGFVLHAWPAFIIALLISMFFGDHLFDPGLMSLFLGMAAVVDLTGLQICRETSAS